MVATTKTLAQIPPSSVPPISTDQLVGVTGGPNDVLFTLAQLQATIPSGAQGPPGPPGPQGPTGIVNGVPDPLSLTTGFHLNAIDPNVIGDPNYSQGANFTITNQSLVSNPGFADANGVEIVQNFLYGQNQYGGGTNAKSTPISLIVQQNAVGAGEHFASSFSMQAYGMSDAFLFTGQLNYAGGCIAGDEGVGFSPSFYVQQQSNLTLAHITSVTRTTLSTTITGNVTGSKSAQVIPVASTTGANVNDWIVFGQAAPSGGPNICAAKIISVGSGTITCICPNNFLSGTTITPALVLGVDTTYQFGQDRVIVNLSGAIYQTGQVYQAGGGGSGALSGVGTAWTTGMVGGSSTNVGAISLDQDLMSDAPFTNTTGPVQAFPTGNMPLNSWYQIVQVASPTGLPIMSMSVANDQSYHGNAQTLAQLKSSTVTISIGSPAVVTWTAHGLAVGTAIRFTTTGALPTGLVANAPYYVASTTANNFQLAVYSGVAAGDRVGTSGSQSGVHTAFNGGYKILPAARVLWVAPQGAALLICESSSATWNVGALIECAISPYPDVHGWDFRLGQWSPGGTRRSGILLSNIGARTIPVGLGISSFSASIQNQHPNSDQLSWGQGVSVDSAQVGYSFLARPGSTAALSIGNQGGTDVGTQITWGAGPPYLRPNSANAGFDIAGITTGFGGLLQFISGSVNEESARTLQSELAFTGYLGIYTARPGASGPFIRFQGPGAVPPNNPVSNGSWDISGPWAGHGNLNFVTYDGGGSPITVMSMSAAAVTILGGDVLVALSNTTGAGSAALGANSPAVTNAAPYTWLRMLSHDGSTVYVPAWK